MKSTRQILRSSVLVTILIASGFTYANDDEVIAGHQQILLEKFPGAEFTEIEIEDYKGQEIFEYEFEYQDRDYEAFITRGGKILRLGLD